MKISKPAIALTGLAAASLAVAQPALAADAARNASPVADSEQLAGVPSGAWIAIVAILGVAAFSIINAANDDDPVSP